MKATILIKRIKHGGNSTTPLPKVITAGEWIDLYAAEDTAVDPSCRAITYIPLGIAAKLPSGYEAIIAPRSSTAEKFHIWCTNSIGIIDNSYSGNLDEWKFPCTTIGVPRATIRKGDRICQFRIQLSEKATTWQRLKWLFTSGIRIEEVEFLDYTDRGGFGTTGKGAL